MLCIFHSMIIAKFLAVLNLPCNLEDSPNLDQPNNYIQIG